MKKKITNISATQPITIYEPEGLATPWPVLLVADGISEVGTLNHAPASIGDQLNKGANLPFLVVNVHKTNDGIGSFQAQRYRDVYYWVRNNYTIDLTRVYVTGLSLSGGAVYSLMTDVSFSKLIAAYVPVCGTADADDQALIAGVKGSGTPFRAYGSSTDNNAPTQSAFTHYIAVSVWTPGGKDLLAKGSFIDTKNGHTQIWATAYKIGTTDLYDWLLKQSRPELKPAAPPPVIVVPTTGEASGVFVYMEFTSPVSRVWVYNDGSGKVVKV